MSDRGRAIGARIAALRDREMPLEEALAYLAAPVEDAERAEVLELSRWFRRMYPTPAARLAYVRRACRRWTASRGAPR